jgi:hypothetical protein
VNRNTSKKVLDRGHQPERAADMIQEAKDELVVYGVESLGEVHQKQVAFFFLLDGLIVEFREVVNVVVYAPTWSEAFLLKEEPIRGDFLEDFLKNRGDDPVVCVSNRNRAGPAGGGCVFSFGEEEEGGHVEPRRRGNAIPQGEGNPQKHRGNQVRHRGPSSERDTVRARSRSARALKSEKNHLFCRSSRRFQQFPGVPVQNVGDNVMIHLFFTPESAPEVRRHVSHLLGVVTEFLHPVLLHLKMGERAAFQREQELSLSDSIDKVVMVTLEVPRWGGGGW